LIRAPLSVLSTLYGGVVATRNMMYERGWIARRRLPWPVISVGGLTSGGVGKTPTVILLARTLRSSGRRPLVLIRGYGAPSPSSEPILVDPMDHLAWRRAGDEAVHLARSLRETPVVAFPNRFEAALWAGSRLSFDIVVLDDGFQHRRLHRDLDLVVMDSERPLGSGRLLPAGDLREGPGSLRRAHATILTRCGGDWANTKATLHGANHLRTRWKIQGFRELGDASTPRPPEELRGLRLGVVSGIGGPERFLDDLTRMGLNIEWSWELPDHEPLRTGDVRRIRHEMAQQRLASVVITEKDEVRWEEKLRDVGSVFVAVGEAAWLEEKDRLRFVEILGRRLD
jgi:tetraacyldisaccharide 4'-kinase